MVGLRVAILAVASWTLLHEAENVPTGGNGDNGAGTGVRQGRQLDSGVCPPLRLKPGMILDCTSTTQRRSNDCQKKQPFGTIATFTCQTYYKPITTLVRQLRTCEANGMWTGREEDFGCELDCGVANPTGRLGLTTPFEISTPGQWPWHAALFFENTESNWEGTLISRRAVLTSATVVEFDSHVESNVYSSARVDLGRHHRDKEDDPFVQKFGVEKFIMHPNYNPSNPFGGSNLAIVILKKRVRIGFHVRPICFPISDDQDLALDDMQIVEGSYATVVGWGLNKTRGRPDEFQAVKRVILGNDRCPIEDKVSTAFCAGNDNGTESCFGKYGGGAYFAVRTATGLTRWFLRGMARVGLWYGGRELEHECDSRSVVIYTRIAAYSDWIARVLSENDAW